MKRMNRGAQGRGLLDLSDPVANPLDQRVLAADRGTMERWTCLLRRVCRGPRGPRALIAEDAEAEARIKANPSPAIKRSLDPDPCRTPPGRECRERIKRFLRIALRCEKTRGSVMGFVFPVSALDPAQMNADRP